MHRQNFTHQAKGWQHHDVDRRVGIEPEQMLVNNNIAAQYWVEKAGVSNDVELSNTRVPSKTGVIEHQDVVPSMAQQYIPLHQFQARAPAV